MNQSKQEKSPREEKKQTSLGKKLTYGFSVGILLVIAVTFIGTPALRNAAGSQQLIFGKYAGRELIMAPGNFFSRDYQKWANYVQQTGQEITDQVYYSVWQTAYYDTVFHTALLVQGEKAGVGASTDALNRAIASWPAFQVDGHFSAAEYQAMSASDRLALRDYLAEVLVTDRVQNDIYDAAQFSDAEIGFIAAMASPERRFRFVEFSADSYPDSEVVAYGEENRQRFRQVRISQITIDSSEADAESIRQQAIDRTVSFEDLARNQSSDEFAADGGDRGWVYYWDLEFDFEDVASVDELFSLGVGDISAVYKTGSRWRIYRVDDAPIDADFQDPEQLAKVRDYITTFERGLVEDYLRSEADSFVTQARADGFLEAALTISQIPQLTEYFPVNYGNEAYFPKVTAPSNSVIESAAAYREETLQALFSLDPGAVSDPLIIRDYAMVFELDDERDLPAERIDTLTAALPNQLSQALVTEINQDVVDQDLLEDHFNATYTTVVRGK